jgi:hypothetical protein
VINENILKVLILSADHAHLKKSAHIINKIGVVNSKEMIAVHGIIIFSRGNIPGKKS